MEKGKYKFKVTKRQLNIIYEVVMKACETDSEEMLMKLIIGHMIGIHQKLMPKWAYPAEKNSITFTSCEAIAFWILFSKIEFTDPAIFSTINPIVNDIHKQYI